jgi:hypothetical protein
MVDANLIPPRPDGFALGSAAIAISGDESKSPATLTYPLGPTELALAGDPSRVKLALWDGAQWVAQSCGVDRMTLSCALPRPGLVALLVPPQAGDVLDWDIDQGHVFEQTNGFDGAGPGGYAVLDDADASFWTEFQRLGGVDQLGYPISNQFYASGGALMQVFQKGALQWDPVAGECVELDVLDALHGAGFDVWLDAHREIPPIGASRDVPVDWSALVDAYGPVVAAKNYGPFTAVRTARTVVQLWPQADGTYQLTEVNAGDVAKDAGLWPMSTTTPIDVSALP